MQVIQLTKIVKKREKYMNFELLSFAFFVFSLLEVWLFPKILQCVFLPCNRERRNLRGLEKFLLYCFDFGLVFVVWVERGVACHPFAHVKNRSEHDFRLAGFCIVIVVFAQATPIVHPTDRTLHHPPLRDHLELMKVVILSHTKSLGHQDS
jgi:hypothetical protein